MQNIEDVLLPILRQNIFIKMIVVQSLYYE